MHKCRDVNHYDHECHRKTYRKKLLQYVESKELPVSQVSTAGPVVPPGDSVALRKHKEWVAETCGKLREKNYEESVFWDGPGSLPFQRNKESDYNKGGN